uniref:Uncharacterized protein n=1 Tax=Chromera velia CCMP2878 TaxID=1169474 RepID=A0A0G4HBJ0_9ALVE|eukprot:Cvel_25975.t1-p1 / transcript=Cvel_25975.t1 / gene=Cvel_25975 / organism=Chromera_velia_CCMP2878 / gene_product=hypothetical protein / transcript_product=hypothetical protein / location=Cvel_scaffold3015:16348-19688(-) / protein_length=640 / sequence_SO=supercontig / SO=protein_coding / is_pseudo=false
MRRGSIGRWKYSTEDDDEKPVPAVPSACTVDKRPVCERVDFEEKLQQAMGKRLSEDPEAIRLRQLLAMAAPALGPCDAKLRKLAERRSPGKGTGGFRVEKLKSSQPSSPTRLSPLPPPPLDAPMDLSTLHEALNRYDARPDFLALQKGPPLRLEFLEPRGNGGGETFSTRSQSRKGAERRDGGEKEEEKERGEGGKQRRGSSLSSRMEGQGSRRSSLAQQGTGQHPRVWNPHRNFPFTIENVGRLPTEEEMFIPLHPQDLFEAHNASSPTSSNRRRGSLAGNIIGGVTNAPSARVIQGPNPRGQDKKAGRKVLGQTKRRQRAGEETHGTFRICFDPPLISIEERRSDEAHVISHKPTMIHPTPSSPPRGRRESSEEDRRGAGSARTEEGQRNEEGDESDRKFPSPPGTAPRPDLSSVVGRSIGLGALLPDRERDRGGEELFSGSSRERDGQSLPVADEFGNPDPPAVFEKSSQQTLARALRVTARRERMGSEPRRKGQGKGKKVYRRRGHVASPREKQDGVPGPWNANSAAESGYAWGGERETQEVLSRAGESRRGQRYTYGQGQVSSSAITPGSSPGPGIGPRRAPAPGPVGAASACHVFVDHIRASSRQNNRKGRQKATLSPKTLLQKKKNERETTQN